MNIHNVSRFNKNKLIKDLSEDDFRDKVVRPLFMKLGYKDGRDLCGPTEEGKDALFYLLDPFGQPEYIAVQTKKGNLSMASSHEKNVLVALTQVQMALKSKFTLLEKKQEIIPTKVYLVISGTLNDRAKKYILDNCDSPNIQFLDIDAIVSLIDEKYPDFWMNMQIVKHPYCKALQDSILKTSDVNKVANSPLDILDNSGIIDLVLYFDKVKQRRYKGQVIPYTDIEEISFRSIINVQSRKILITGEGGAGKSTGLEQIVLTLTRKIIDGDTKSPMPILIKASELLKRKEDNLKDICFYYTKEFLGAGLEEESCFTIEELEKGSITILIDALDEVPSDQDKEKIIALLNSFSFDFPFCQIILTSRQNNFASSMSNFEGFISYRVAAIDWRQAEKIIRKMRSAESDELITNDVLRQLEKLHNFDLTPLVVTVFASTLSINKQDIPANITELFKKFTELMLGRWDEQKGLDQQYQSQLKDFILKNLAFKMHFEEITEIHLDDASSFIDQVLRNRGYAENAQFIINEIIERSGLFKKDHNDMLSFRHLLLQEFFAGRGITREVSLLEILSNEWWRRAVVFYFGEESQADNIKELSSITRSMAYENNQQYLDAAYTVGLAIQACYLSEVKEKIQLWKWVVVSLNKFIPEVSVETTLNEKFPLLNNIFNYLMSKDSVSLSNLKDNWEELINDDCWEYEISKEDKLYWLVIALIESGNIQIAELLLKKTVLSDNTKYLSIQMGCMLAHKVRPLSRDEKEAAERICNELDGKVSVYTREIQREQGSLLLEIKKGNITSDIL